MKIIFKGVLCDYNLNNYDFELTKSPRVIFHVRCSSVNPGFRDFTAVIIPSVRIARCIVFVLTLQNSATLGID